MTNRTVFPTAAALLVVGLFILLAYAPAILRSDFLLTSGDGRRAFYPQFCWLRQEFPAVPLWTNALGGGFPLIDESQSAAFYPPLVAALAVPGAAVAFNLYQLAHLVFLFYTAFLFGRQLTGSQRAALVVAATLTFSGQVLGRMDHCNQPVTYAWIPLIFYLTRRWLEQSTARGLALLGIAWGLTLLAGHNQVTLFAWLGLVPMALFYALFPAPAMESAAVAGTVGCRLRRGLLVCVVPPLLGALLAGVQLVPFFQLYSQSVRGGGLALAVADNINLSSWNLLLLVYPFMFGNPGEFWLTARYLAEASFYVGLIPLALIMPTVVAGRSAQRREIIFWWLFTGVFLLLAMGERTPLYNLLHRLPVFSGAIGPIRFLFVAQLGLAALAGFGTLMVKARPWTVVRGVGAVLMLAVGLYLATDCLADSWREWLRAEVLLVPGEIPARLAAGIGGFDLGRAILLLAGLLAVVAVGVCRPRLAFVLLALLLVVDGASFARRLLQPTVVVERDPAALAEKKYPAARNRFYHLACTDDDAANVLLPTGNEDFAVYNNFPLRPHARFGKLVEELCPRAVWLSRVGEFHSAEPKLTAAGVAFLPLQPLAIVTADHPWRFAVPAAAGEPGQRLTVRMVLALSGTLALPPGTEIGALELRRAPGPGETTALIARQPIRARIESGDLMAERTGDSTGGTVVWREPVDNLHIYYYQAEFAFPSPPPGCELVLTEVRPGRGIIVAGVALMAGDSMVVRVCYPFMAGRRLGGPPAELLPELVAVGSFIPTSEEDQFYWLAADDTAVPSGMTWLPQVPGSGPAVEGDSSPENVRIEIITQTDERVVAITVSQLPLPLLRLVAWYPEWECRIDGELVPVWVAAGMFQAVAVPAGEHIVEFIYARRAFHAGLFMTLLAGGLLGYLYWRRA